MILLSQWKSNFLKYFFRCVLGFFLGYFISTSYAGDVVRDLAFFEDKNGSLGIQDITEGNGIYFKPLPSGNFSGGFSRSAFWFRFTVAGYGERWLDVLPAVLGDVRLYEESLVQPGTFNERRTGTNYSFAEREVPYRGFIFKLRHANSEPHTYYVRLKTGSSAVFSPRVWEPTEFFTEAVLEAGLLMASIAIILTVILLNVNAWFWIRDPLTPWFLGYLALLAAHFSSLSGLLQQYVIPEIPEVYDYLRVLFSLLLFGAGNAFYRRYFNIDSGRPFLYWLYKANSWLPILLLAPALAGFFTEIAPFVNFGASILIVVGVVLSFNLWRQGVAGGGMMLIANVVSLASILTFILNVLGWLSGGFAVWHSLHIASLGTILALQIAVGARYRQLRDESILAEQEARSERELRIQQGAFLSMLAHELRTALTVLQMAIGRQPMTACAMASAERAIAGMNDVIDRSIQAEALADGKLQPECLPCNVSSLLQEVIADSRDPERVTFHSDIQRHNLVTDEKLLRVIVTNLIDNALKYGKSEELVFVELRQSDRVVIRVRNPIGAVGKPDMTRVFEKHYRAPQAHETIGSGLGLYISQSMCKRLGGEIKYREGEHEVCFEVAL